MEQNISPTLSEQSKEQMLKSIVDSMVEVADEVYDMAVILGQLLPGYTENTQEEMS